MSTAIIGFVFLASGLIHAAASRPAPQAAPAGTTRYTMANGLDVILRENHSSPMIASVVFVRSGSKYESDFNNGVTHFLEHLLFDGTATRSQEQISDRIKNLGGYINAFTRKEVTAYLSLVPAEHIAEALDIQQDMIFNSIFPEDRFPKERKIVIEEIRKDSDTPDYVAEEFHDRWAYAGSPYARPVLGYENLIATIPRDDVINYYHTYYQPNNMALLVIGDFRPESMRSLLENSFGQHPARPIPPRPAITVPGITGRMVERTQADIGETRIDVHLRLPAYTDAAYYPLSLLTEILNDEARSPLHKSLMEGEHALATNVSAALETQAEFTALRIGAATDKPGNADSIVAVIERTLRALPQLTLTAEDLQAMVTRLRVEDLLLRERLHYYAIMKAPMIAVTGYDFVEELPDRLSKVTLAQMRQTAAKYLTGDNYVATVVTPRDTSAERQAAGGVAKTTYARRTLANGLEVVIKSNPDSKVFAVDVLGKYRSACEPPGQAGISDFVNRMLICGTESRSADQIKRELAAIGAELTTNDNPYIPYDDQYTTPQYTFIKMATIDEYAPTGAELLADMIGHATFPVDELEKTRRQVTGLLGMSQGSTGQTCRGLFYSTLFAGQPYAQPVMGTAETVARFTPDDLKRHRQTLYAPQNMIIACATNLPPDQAFALIESTFGKLPSGTPPTLSAVPPPKAPKGVQTQHQTMKKEQVYIYLGAVLPGASDSDATALMVANQILNAHLGAELRERLGLAYSVGSSVNFDRDFGWLICAIGTGKKNYAAAKDGIIAQIRRLQDEPVTPEELETAQNTLWGSSLTSRLSRVNQAFYMAVDEFLGWGYDHSDKLADMVRRVTAADVSRVAKKWFDTQDYVLATVGNLE